MQAREALSRNFRNQAYQSVDADESRTVRINLPPQLVANLLVTEVPYTFGQHLAGVHLPAYADMEGDPILMTFKNDKHPFWNIYGVLVKTVVESAYTVNHFDMYSDVINEGVNVASAGVSSITVTWTDANTGQAASPLQIKLEIMDAGAYAHFMLTYVAPVVTGKSKTETKSESGFKGFVSTENQEPNK